MLIFVGPMSWEDTIYNLRQVQSNSVKYFSKFWSKPFASSLATIKLRFRKSNALHKSVKGSPAYPFIIAERPFFNYSRYTMFDNFVLVSTFTG